MWITRVYTEEGVPAERCPSAPLWTGQALPVPPWDAATLGIRRRPHEAPRCCSPEAGARPALHLLGAFPRLLHGLCPRGQLPGLPSSGAVARASSCAQAHSRDTPRQARSPLPCPAARTPAPLTGAATPGQEVTWHGRHPGLAWPGAPQSSYCPAPAASRPSPTPAAGGPTSPTLSPRPLPPLPCPWASLARIHPSRPLCSPAPLPSPSCPSWYPEC